MKWAMLVVPDVFTMVLPSGLAAMPSGSTPVGICAITSRVGTAVTEATADFLVNRRMDKSQHIDAPSIMVLSAPASESASNPPTILDRRWL
jgi:hypothetical protein